MTAPAAQVLEGEDDVEDSQELQDVCHFFEFTQVCKLATTLIQT
jgi:NADH:ubiquinone oxidoreductase subunit F (NADH-binding)